MAVDLCGQSGLFFFFFKIVKILLILRRDGVTCFDTMGVKRTVYLDCSQLNVGRKDAICADLAESKNVIGRFSIIGAFVHCVYFVPENVKEGGGWFK